MFAPYRPSASAYSTVHVETGVQAADPHRLVVMLLDGAISAIAGAMVAMERRDIPGKCKAICKAVNIVEEGLRAPLNMREGGQVAKTLQDLYACVVHRLTKANLNNDPALLRECSGLLTPLRDAWTAIKTPSTTA